MSEICKGMITLLIPFRFKYNNLLWKNFESIDGLPGWDKDESLSNTFKTNIHYMLKDDGGVSAIGKIFTLNRNVWETQKLRYDYYRKLPIPKDNISIKHNNKEIGMLKMSSIKIALFFSNIGFLSLGFEIDKSNTILNVKEINYYLSQLKRDSVSLFYKRELNKQGIFDEKDISILTIFKFITDKLKEHIAIEETDKKIDSSKSIASGTGLTFGYLVFDQNYDFDSKDAQFDMANIINAQKESYKTKYVDNEFYQPFKNIRWGFSSKSVFCFSHLVDDESTNKFLLENHSTRINNQYFVLFLLRQHQRFGLELIEQKCSTALYSYPTINDEKRDMIKNLRLYIGHFRLMTEYCDPTSINHVNTVDNKISNVLGIDKNNSRLKNYINELDVHSKELESVAAKENEIKSLKKSTIVSIGTIIWTTILAINQGVDFIDKWLKKDSLSSPILMFGFLIGAIVLAPQIYNLIKTKDTIKEKEKEIKYLRNNNL